MSALNINRSPSFLCPPASFARGGIRGSLSQGVPLFRVADILMASPWSGEGGINLWRMPPHNRRASTDLALAMNYRFWSRPNHRVSRAQFFQAARPEAKHR